MAETITQPDNTVITLNKSADYRDSYANSVQVRMSVWDFFLVFGTLEQQSQHAVTIENLQGIYLSPQQAKALHSVLTANLAQYEASFGPIGVPGENDPAASRFVVPAGPVH